MAAGGGERQVGVGAHRVDRAVAGRDPGQAGLQLAHLHLVAPVGALEVVAVLIEEAHLAAGVADLRDRRRRATSRRSASGRQLLLASEKASISPLRRSAAAFCAATLPPRGSSSTRSAPAERARSTVASLEPSEATIS